MHASRELALRREPAGVSDAQVEHGVREDLDIRRPSRRREDGAQPNARLKLADRHPRAALDVLDPDAWHLIDDRRA
jgi:hypothetical protein